jgi:hypothetical protein
MKPVADSLPLEPAIKLIQNVVVSPDSGSNYVICMINKRLLEHSWCIGRITIENIEQRSHVQSILYMDESVLGLVISSDVHIAGCDHRLCTCRPQ